MTQTEAIPVSRTVTNAQRTPYRKVSNAVRTVLVYTIADVFSLEDEETMWVAYQVGRVMEPLINAKPRAIPLPVKRELESGIYSRLLVEGNSKARQADGTTVQASIQDWSQVLADIVIQSYNLRPLMDATIVASFTGILKELGVGHKDNPRASKYLPTAVRHALNSND